MIDFGWLLLAFFEWNWQRFKSPFVICGLIVMLIGIMILIFSNKIAYSITLKLKDADDKKLANVGLIVKGIAFVFALIGALLAVLFIS